MANLVDLCADLPLRTVPTGDVLIGEGADPTRMYVLVSGGVTIERDGLVFARIDNPGAVFGEMGVALGRPATATVRASSDVVVHVVEDPSTFLTERPGAALAVLRITAARLDGMTHYLVDIKRQFAEHENHLGMVDQILDSLLHHQAAPTRTGSARDPEGDAGHDH